MKETVQGSPRRRRFVVAISALSVALLVGGIGAGTAVAQLGGAQEQKIILKSLKFTPNKITITKTTKVSFIWKESVAHNIVFDNKGPKSGTLNKGQWSPVAATFATPGTYKYKCTLHPGMNGQITVK